MTHYKALCDCWEEEEKYIEYIPLMRQVVDSVSDLLACIPPQTDPTARKMEKDIRRALSELFFKGYFNVTR